MPTSAQQLPWSLCEKRESLGAEDWQEAPPSPTHCGTGDSPRRGSSWQGTPLHPGGQTRGSGQEMPGASKSQSQPVGQRIPVQEWSSAERRRVAGRGGAQPGARGQRDAQFPLSGRSSGKVSCPQVPLPEAGMAIEPGRPGQRASWGRRSQRLPICQSEDQVPHVWSRETSVCLSACGPCGLSICFPVREVGRKVSI